MGAGCVRGTCAGFTVPRAEECPGLALQVGAGTMNPATFLRVLGSEPWRVCYVEPSVRPDDSRYGENPNRLQQHTQFQASALAAGASGPMKQCC